MRQFHPRSVAFQVADFLKEELRQGTWEHEIPGIVTLATKLGVNHKTVETALKQLEQEGLLETQGPGRPRRITLFNRRKLISSLRIGILLFDQTSLNLSYLSKIRYSLENEGHEIVLSPKTMCSLKHDPLKIAKMAKQCLVDCWIIPSANREILKWFATQDQPAFALAGRFRNLPIPAIAPDKVPAMREALKKMVANNHQRIVLLTRRSRRSPKPGRFERLFLKELENHRITPSKFHLPDWDEDATGFHSGLESLFQLTPPTAIIADESEFIGGILQFCTQKGLAVPRDLSLLSSDPDPSFTWFHPQISHIHWSTQPIIRRIVRWIHNVSIGVEDIRQSSSKATFIEGGTIGPVK